MKISNNDAKLMLNIIYKNVVMDLTTLRLRDKLEKGLSEKEEEKKIDSADLISQAHNNRFIKLMKDKEDVLITNLKADGYDVKEVKESEDIDYDDSNSIWALGYYFGCLNTLKNLKSNLK